MLNEAFTRVRKQIRDMSPDERREFHKQRIEAIKARPPVVSLQDLSDKLDKLTEEVAALKVALKIK